MSDHPTEALGGYLLGVLPVGDEPGVRRHLEDCEACRIRVNDLEGISELLAAARLVPEEAPRLAPHILATLPRPGQAFALGRSEQPPPGARQDPPADDSARDRSANGHHRLRRRTAVIASAVIVIAAVVAAAILHAGNSDKLPAVTLSPSGTDAVGRATFGRSAAGTEMLLEVRALPPGVYEVTVDDGVTVLPAGGFSVDSAGTATVTLHTAATSGELQISESDGDSHSVLLRAMLPG